MTDKIKLPALPACPDDTYDWSDDEKDAIRARDIEVAECVLEAAAKEMEKVFSGHLIYGYPVGETIRNLKVSHD